MMKKGIALLLILMIVFLVGCSTTQKYISNDLPSTDISSQDLQEKDDSLEALLTIDLQKLSKIDIVMIEKNSDGMRVYKEFSDREDIDEIMGIICNSSLTDAVELEEEVPNGWNMLFRFWTDGSTPAFMLSPLGDNKVIIGDKMYSVKDLVFADSLIEYYDNSNVEEKEYS